MIHHEYIETSFLFNKIKFCKEVKRKLNIVKSIQKNSSWLFLHGKCKGIFSFSFFALTSTPLLTIFRTMLMYPQEA